MHHVWGDQGQMGARGESLQTYTAGGSCLRGGKNPPEQEKNMQQRGVRAVCDHVEAREEQQRPAGAAGGACAWALLHCSSFLHGPEGGQCVSELHMWRHMAMQLSTGCATVVIL